NPSTRPPPGSPSRRTSCPPPSPPWPTRRLVSLWTGWRSPLEAEAPIRLRRRATARKEAVPAGGETGRCRATGPVPRRRQKATARKEAVSAGGEAGRGREGHRPAGRPAASETAGGQREGRRPATGDCHRNWRLSGGHVLVSDARKSITSQGRRSGVPQVVHCW